MTFFQKMLLPMLKPMILAEINGLTPKLTAAIAKVPNLSAADQALVVSTLLTVVTDEISSL